MIAPGRSFERVYGSLQLVQGWMSRDQAERLWAAAARTGAGDRIVEIGSYHGRSAIVLASASPVGVEVIAIDPHAGSDRGPGEIAPEQDRGQRDHEAFLANLAAAGVRNRVRHLRQFSQASTAQVPGQVEVVYIDGAHRFAPALADIRRWGAKVAPGGTLLVHDSFSSIGVTLALLVSLVPGARFRYVGRSRSLAEYRRVDLTGLQRLRNAGRQCGQLGYFARNVLYKVLIVRRLRRLAMLLGSDGSWPY
jgi:predicted O-methyltransferase YrrM